MPTTDLERSTFQNKPAYRYIRASDKLPAIYKGDGVARIKLFNPTGAGTWYLSEYDPETRQAFGLADLGCGAELGYISMEELVEFRGRFGLPIERDLYWTPKPLSEITRGD